MEGQSVVSILAGQVGSAQLGFQRESDSHVGVIIHIQYVYWKGRSQVDTDFRGSGLLHSVSHGYLVVETDIIS